MILHFHIEYHTQWGEELRVAGDEPQLGGYEPGKALPMQTTDGVHWTASIPTPSHGRVTSVKYRYEVYRDGRSVRTEWTAFPRRVYLLNVRSKHKVCHLLDHWIDQPQDRCAYSSAFTDSLKAHLDRDPKPERQYATGVILKVMAPGVDGAHQLCLSGNAVALGAWNPQLALPMNDTDFPIWQVEVGTEELTGPLEYKFILREKATGKLVAWEQGFNHVLPLPASKGETLVVTAAEPDFGQRPWRGAGVAVPVFSLRSEGSFGVGDFGDLQRLIDWAASTHQRVVQILPINDTTMTHTWTDSYPYNSISIYAFHPMYLDLRQLPPLQDEQAATRLETLRQALNALPQIDYEAVNQAKWEYIRLVYKQEKAHTLRQAGYRNFFEANKDWLQPYAAYCYLRDSFGTPDFHQWPSYSTFDAQEVEILCRPTSRKRDQIAIYYYVQYHLHLQLKAASEYARHHGVVLKGDIPIGISRNSVEAWKEPYYFNMNGQAGAPPDDFSVNGQNWGFPTYNWEVMEQDGYAWWMKRFQKMSEYFDAYRIDHILGFFRIWEIPMHSVHGLLGQFVPALPMTREEIESYGLRFREDFFLQPYIHEYFLHELFGDQTDWVKQTFIQETDTYEVYRMRPAFDTQRKVEAYFAGRTDADSVRVRDGLYTLLSDVLFVPDRHEPYRYHPRISVLSDYVYRALSDREKEAFYRLYVHYYYHRHNDFWYQQAMKKLPRLTGSTRMLVCGEDLGMIPSCVPTVMEQLRILSLEIQSMPKDPEQEFGNPAGYPYRSVCTISTHDTSTMRGWWEENAEQTQRYYNHVLGHTGAAPAVATPEICQEIVASHLHGQSMLCILSFQDWMSIDGDLRYPEAAAERINVPANPRHYWRYRMHLTLEQLADADGLNERIRQLIKESDREG